MPTFLQSVHSTQGAFKTILSSTKDSLIVVPVLQSGENPKEPQPIISSELTDIEAIIGFSISDFFTSEDFKAAAHSSLYLGNPTLQNAFLFVGCGPKERLRNYRLHTSFAKALSGIKRKSVDTIIATVNPIANDNTNTAFQAALQLACAAGDLCYASREAKEPGRSVQKLTIHSTAELTDFDSFAIATARARGIAMDLVNEPANSKRTDTLVNEAKRLAALGLQVEITDDINWIQKEMPCFYEVGRGSLASDPPKWIRVSYTPKTEIKKKIAIVGKSVIFDTGGYQVKPDPYMNTMKADMTGGATALAVIEAVAALQLPNLQVTAYLAATPNKIDSDAMLPDSIVNTSSGKKVEIRHTDAEGRLTLIDAVHQAEKTEPDLMFTIATLTGSAARAVGPRTALMATDTTWRDEFAKAMERHGDSCQTLDIVEEDFDDIKSKLDGADINNTGHEKYRGAQTAASFIFSGLTNPKRPLLHLDVAGGDMTQEEKATGIAVRGFIGFLRELSENPER